MSQLWKNYDVTVGTVFLTLYMHLETLLALHAAATQVGGGDRVEQGRQRTVPWGEGEGGGQITTDSLRIPFFHHILTQSEPQCTFSLLSVHCNSRVPVPPPPPNDGSQLCSGLSVGGTFVDAGFWALDCVAGSVLLSLVRGGEGK